MTTTRAVTIQGHSFDIRTPYVEGHTCTAPEAAALNQTRAENVGNSCRAKIKALLNGATELNAEQAAEATTAIEAYDASYEFAFRAAAVGRASADPVERHAQKIAVNAVKAQLLADKGPESITKYFGRLKKDATEAETAVHVENKAKIAVMVNEVASRDSVLAKARKNVKADEKKRAEEAEAAGGVSLDTLTA